MNLPRQARVIIFNDTPRNGGPGKVLLHFLRYSGRKALYRTVHLMRPDVMSALYEREGVTDGLSFDPRLVENPIQPLSRPMERKDFGAPFWLKAGRVIANIPRAVFGLRALGRRVRSGQFDLLYCNGLYAVLVGGLLARLGGIPVLWHLHDTSLPRVLTGIFRWMGQSPHVRSIVCVSNASSRMVDFAREKTVIALNPVDLEEFDRKTVTPALRLELGWSKEAIIFGSHGRVVARKGYQTMIHAARKAVDDAPDALKHRLCFVVIGDTPADHPGDYLDDCRTLVSSLSLDDHFAFPGYRTDVRPYVADYDVCVVPSIFAEPFGLTVVEGFAFSRPVIASAVGGIPEIVRQNETGLLVPAGDVGALAAAILTYAADARLRALHGAAGRAYVEANHDARTYAAAIERIVIGACHLEAEVT